LNEEDVYKTAAATAELFNKRLGSPRVETNPGAAGVTAPILPKRAKPKKRAKEKIVSICMEAEVHRALMVEAASAGISVSEFIRRKVSTPSNDGVNPVHYEMKARLGKPGADVSTRGGDPVPGTYDSFKNDLFTGIVDLTLRRDDGVPVVAKCTSSYKHVPAAAHELLGMMRAGSTCETFFVWDVKGGGFSPVNGVDVVYVESMGEF